MNKIEFYEARMICPYCAEEVEAGTFLEGHRALVHRAEAHNWKPIRDLDRIYEACQLHFEWSVTVGTEVAFRLKLGRQHYYNGIGIVTVVGHGFFRVAPTRMAQNIAAGPHGIRLPICGANDWSKHNTIRPSWDTEMLPVELERRILETFQAQHGDLKLTNVRVVQHTDDAPTHGVYIVNDEEAFFRVMGPGNTEPHEAESFIFIMQF
jgi:hypothetical protein